MGLRRWRKAVTDPEVTAADCVGPHLELATPRLGQWASLHSPSATPARRLSSSSAWRDDRCCAGRAVAARCDPAPPDCPLSYQCSDQVLTDHSSGRLNPLGPGLGGPKLLPTTSANTDAYSASSSPPSSAASSSPASISRAASTGDAALARSFGSAARVLPIAALAMSIWR